jgi:DNA-binding transcriptional ArsR family regulator
MGRRPKPPIVDPELARFIAVADPSRWAIVRLLRSRARSVQEVAREVGLSLPVTSRHLQRLRAAGIVAAERRGKTLLCRLSPKDTVGGNWLARAIDQSTTPAHEDEPRRVTVQRERPRRATVATVPAGVASAATTPSLPRRELDDYLL